MHHEFERALGVRRRPGLSLLGWVVVAISVLALLGGMGGWFVYLAVSGEARRIAERLETSWEASEPGLVARTLVETMEAAGVTPSVEGEALAGVVQRTLAAGSGAARPAAAPARAESGDEVEGFLRIRTPDGDLTADLRAGGSGGALAVRGVDGDLLLDVSADEAGGRLWLRGEGEVARFDTGFAVEPAPVWLPPVAHRGRLLQPVVTGRAGGSAFGAATWLSEEPPAAVVERARATLEAEGWEISAEHRVEGRGDARASLVGRAPGTGRTVVLAAERNGEATRVVLGWGEGDGGAR